MKKKLISLFCLLLSIAIFCVGYKFCTSYKQATDGDFVAPHGAFYEPIFQSFEESLEGKPREWLEGQHLDVMVARCTGVNFDGKNWHFHFRVLERMLGVHDVTEFDIQAGVGAQKSMNYTPGGIEYQIGHEYLIVLQIYDPYNPEITYEPGWYSYSDVWRDLYIPLNDLRSATMYDEPLTRHSELTEAQLHREEFLSYVRTCVQNHPMWTEDTHKTYEDHFYLYVTLISAASGIVVLGIAALITVVCIKRKKKKAALAAIACAAPNTSSDE